MQVSTPTDIDEYVPDKMASSVLALMLFDIMIVADNKEGFGVERSSSIRHRCQSRSANICICRATARRLSGEDLAPRLGSPTPHTPAETNQPTIQVAERATACRVIFSAVRPRPPPAIII